MMVSVNHQDKTILLWQPTMFDGSETPMAGREVLVPLTGESPLRFHLNYIRGMTQAGYRWYYYVPLPKDKKALIDNLSDIMKSAGIKPSDLNA